jgi:hypothetical protein
VWVYNRQEAIMGNMHRAQLLLEPEQHEALAEDAIEELSRIRSRVREQHGIYPGQPLAEVRAEWEEKAGEVWRGEA